MWAIGPWRLDAGTGELSQGSELQRVEPKVAEVLVFLATRAGQVVSRDELLSAVWPGVVVGDDALTQAIIKLRKALGDDARRPAYIETLAKRGYRLIAPVSAAAEPARGTAGARAGAAVPAAALPAAAVPAAAAPAAAVAATAAVAERMAGASPPADASLAPETAEARGTQADTASASASASAPVSAAAGPEAAAPARAKRWRLAALGGGLATIAIAAAMTLGIHRTWPWPIGSTDAPRATAETLPVIAVLPLVNASGDPAREFFSDGVTDEIIHALGRYSGLRVISRNSVQQFKQREASARVVSQELGARYVVTGSVREEGGQVRVAVELSDAQTARVLWSEHFDRRGGEVFAIQDSIVRNVVGALAVKVTKLESDRAAARPPREREAYDLVLLARSLEAKAERAANRQGRALIAQAQQLAPDYALAYVVESELEVQRADLGWMEDPAQGLMLAERAARRALALDDPGASALAHARLARIHTFRGEHPQALAESERARALNPSDTSIAEARGQALLWVGRSQEAVELFEGAFRLDPAGRSSPERHVIVPAYFAAERYAEALAACERGLADHPGLPMLHAMRAALLAQAGRLDEARQSAAEVRRLQPNFPVAEFGDRFSDKAITARFQAALRKAGL
ncbi:MAG: winged helix-turn-helix domain-containing protein [Rubrivivax sp.]|nr:winged helix-turn-helix domain-containing protein [Rubrivivax sp.]